MPNPTYSLCVVLEPTLGEWPAGLYTVRHDPAVVAICPDSPARPGGRRFRYVGPAPIDTPADGETLIARVLDWAARSRVPFSPEGRPHWQEEHLAAARRGGPEDAITAGAEVGTGSQ